MLEVKQWLRTKRLVKRRPGWVETTVHLYVSPDILMASGWSFGVARRMKSDMVRTLLTDEARALMARGEARH